MDNLQEGDRNSSKDIAYSSQDILSNSLAGKKEKFFTRIQKSRVPLKEKLLKSYETKNPATDNRKNNRHKAIILCVGITVFIAIVATTIILIVRSNTLETNNTDTINETTSGDTDNVVDNDENQTENIPDEVSALKPDPNDENISQGDYLTKQIEYVNSLIDNNFPITAGYELESIMSDVEMYTSSFTDCQLASAYKAMSRLEQTEKAEDEQSDDEESFGNGTDEEDNVSTTTKILEKMRSATEVCSE